MSPKGNPATHRILSVTEEELSRIVLDIHDGPVQYLFAGLSLLTRLQHEIETECPQSEHALPTIRQVSGMMEESLREIKFFLGTFRPPEFPRRPLTSIIEALVVQHEQWTGQTINLIIETVPEDVTLPAKIAVYRVLQEALSNSYRHAGSEQVEVKLWSRGSSIFLQVVDQGNGFEPPPLHGPKATEREEHIGLRGMRDRVTLLGGKFHLDSSPGEGTRILVKIPVNV
jgi:signal transduction histidine kinase